MYPNIYGNQQPTSPHAIDVFQNWTTGELRDYIQDGSGVRPPLRTSHTDLVREAARLAKEIETKFMVQQRPPSNPTSPNYQYQHHPSFQPQPASAPPLHKQDSIDPLIARYQAHKSTQYNNNSASPTTNNNNNNNNAGLKFYDPIAMSPLLQIQQQSPVAAAQQQSPFDRAVSNLNTANSTAAAAPSQQQQQQPQKPKSVQNKYPPPISPFLPATQPTSPHPPPSPSSTVAAAVATPPSVIVGTGRISNAGSDGTPATTPPASLDSYERTMNSLDRMARLSIGSGTSGETRPGSTGTHRRTSGSMELYARHWECEWTDIEIIKQIGKGSFGKVYLAYYRETKVAVKVLFKEENTSIAAAGAMDKFTWSEPMVRELLEEAGLMSSLRSPNIISFMAMCTEPHAAIISEFCSNGSLADVYLKARKNAAFAAELTWERRLRLLKGAAKGIHFLHTNRPPIIHRDLKSPNLLVDEFWNVKVADFNLSRIAEASSGGSTMAGMNPRWLAPEVIQGNPATAASDVYSFGIIMWETLTFETPFGKSNPWVVSAAISARNERPKIPTADKLPGGATFPGLSRYIRLMESCWQVDAAKRPPMQAVIRELRELQHMV